MSREEDMMLKKVLISAQRMAPEDRQLATALIDVYLAERNYQQAINVGEDYMRIVTTDRDIIQQLAPAFEATQQHQCYRQWLIDATEIEGFQATVVAEEATGEQVVRLTPGFKKHQHALAQWPLHDQLGLLQTGNEVQIQFYQPEIQALLQHKALTVTQRVFALEALHRIGDEQQYRLTIRGQTLDCVPAHTPLRSENLFYHALIEAVVKRLADNTPDLANEAVVVIRRHQTALYPQVPSQQQLNEWVEAYVSWLERIYHGVNHSDKQMQKALILDEIDRYALENIGF
ncbi:hypothetical protein [Brochothrix campestris]|uniref:Uncharacterized protein n=1 Tax=Brochothrix campestris FSL F6-1037 TaxID=1265861 RepID=W7CM97_9LIST|nr:hypothetical protein [Brochothrix campestris]EUJ40684.1 hypothetical protein BCAMP_04822 [Brochothrix campestris FSL F6-1037]